MNSFTILKKGATILHDGIAAHTPEGTPVFILPANLPAPQLAHQPEGMIVYSVPEQQFPPLVLELLGSKERLRLPVKGPQHEPPDHPRSGRREQQVDADSAGADDRLTG